jgi:hypothetical protein
VVSVTHEAVLRIWPRVSEWTEQNREFLRIRSRVEQSRARWKQQPDDSLLLADGVPLREGCQLLAEASHLLDTETEDYITRSTAYHTANKRRRRNLVIGFSTLAAMLLIGVGWYGWQVRNQTQAAGIVNAIVAANPVELERLIEKELPSHRAIADGMLRKVSEENSDRKRMATVGSVYSVDRFVRTPQQVLDALFHEPNQVRDPDLPKRPRPQHKLTYARLDDEPGPDAVNGQAAVFGWLEQNMKNRLKKRRKHVPVVALMDGQQSLWDMLVTFQITEVVVEILDILHVTPRIWSAAKLIHSSFKEQTKFVYEQTGRILNGEVKSVVHSLRSLATRRELSNKKKASLEVICNYLAKNADHMRYNEYLAAGYPIASGVIEGACRHVVKDRLERTGMSWTRSGAQAMLNLRAIWTSNRWDDYVKYRVEKESNRLYPHRDLIKAIDWPIAA